MHGRFRTDSAGSPFLLPWLHAVFKQVSVPNRNLAHACKISLPHSTCLGMAGRTLIGTGNIFIVIGVVLAVGWKKSKDFMFQWQRARGTSIFRASKIKKPHICIRYVCPCHALSHPKNVLTCLHACTCMPVQHVCMYILLTCLACMHSLWILPSATGMGSVGGAGGVLWNIEPLWQLHSCSRLSHQEHTRRRPCNHSHT
jgi:hypothetical protein